MEAELRNGIVDDLNEIPKSTRSYQKQQNDLVGAVIGFYSMLDKDTAADEDCGVQADTTGTRKVKLAMDVSFISNVLLLAIKLVAYVTSPTAVLLASMVDSGLDILSGSILWITAKFIDKNDPTRYPQGKSRFEPVSIALFATLMGIASFQILMESVRVLVAGFDGEALHVATAAWAIMGVTVGLKAALWRACVSVEREYGSATVAAYAEDHRNDALSNSVALLAIGLAVAFPKQLWWADSVGACGVALYILVQWVATGHENVLALAGAVAPVELLQRLTHCAFAHDARVCGIDTVRAYHFGLRHLVEVDIVLPETMNVREAHNIAEALQFKLEDFEEVERAFVHIDFETTHSADYEHGGRFQPDPHASRATLNVV